MGILGELIQDTLRKAFHFGIAFPSYVQTELRIISALVTLQILIFFPAFKNHWDL